jgi:hypothetical protein
MRQWFQVDRPVALAYLALSLAACNPNAVRLAPAGAHPVSGEQVASWVGPTTPTTRALHRFKWLYKDKKQSAGGRGSVRIAPPDSLRFDAAGPLGAARSAAVVVGDSEIWVEPEKGIRDLIPNFPLLWAMFGVARLPSAGAELHGLEEPARIYWSYASGADTVEYLRVFEKPAKIFAVAHQGGKIIGRVETRFDESGQLARSRLVVPRPAAQLDLTFYANSTDAAFSPDIWLRRQP